MRSILLRRAHATSRKPLSYAAFSSAANVQHTQGFPSNGIQTNEMKPKKNAVRRRFIPRTETFIERESDATLNRIREDVLLQGSRVRKSPFFEATLRFGCTGFTVYNRMIMPISWEGQNAMDEYHNLCENVNLYDASIQRQVEISGPDAAALAQYISSRDISKQKIGKCTYVLCTDEEGVIINDPLVLKLEEDRYWFSIADRDLVLWGKALAYSRDFDVQVEEADVSSVAIQGPKSLPMICDLFGPQMEDLKFFNFAKVEWHGIPTIVARAGWAPERGYEIYLDGDVDSNLADDMWKELVQMGAKYNLMFGCPNQYRRLEGGMISACDYENTQCNALELGLPKFVHLDRDHDFVGKAALQEIAREGPRRKVVGIVMDNDVTLDKPLTQMWPLSGDGSDKTGYMTSVGYSPRLSNFIGIATVPIELADPGSRVVVDTNCGAHAGTVSEMPFPGTVEPSHKKQ